MERLVVPENQANCVRVQVEYVITEVAKLVVVVLQPPPQRFIVQLQMNMGL